MLRGAVLLAGLSVAAGAVIGIDLGGEFIKASLVKPRVPLDIVVNPEGRRRTEAVVGMFDGEQVSGKMALSQQSRRPLNFVSFLKMLVGKGPATKNLGWLKETHYPHEWTEVDGAGTLQVRPVEPQLPAYTRIHAVLTAQPAHIQ